MNPDDLARILDELGKRLGPTGEYVFSLAVRQVYIEAIVGIGLFVLMIGALIVIVPRAYRWVQEDGNDNGYPSDRAMVALISGLLSIFLVVFLSWNAVYQLQNVLNPEYAALRAILGAVGPR